MKSFEAIVKEMDCDLRPEKSYDIVKRELIVADRNAVLYFTDGFIKDDIYEKMLEFLFKMTPEELLGIDDMSRFAKNKLPYVEVTAAYALEELKTAVLSGPSVLLIDGIYGGLIVDTRTYPLRSVEEPHKDKSLRGSRDGFVEALVMNTAMIRRRIRDTRLRMEYMQIGKSTKLDVVIGYMEGLADKKTLKILRERLSCIEVTGILMTQQALSEKLQKTAFLNPFPKFKFTERPDYASACILDGRIALIMDNSPTVMLIPVSLCDFFRETDDYYFLPATGSYIRTLRVTVAAAMLFITPLYLLLMNNQGYIPQWLSFLKSDRQGAIPLVLQLILLEILVDGLRLASVNTPDTLSSSLGIIGGLLISEFAVNVGWFTPEAILFTAFVTVGSFALPSFEMSYAMKLERILLLLAVQLFGIYGLAATVAILFICMLNIKTLSGRGYLYPVIPFNAKAFAELFVRRPMK